MTQVQAEKKLRIEYLLKAIDTQQAIQMVNPASSHEWQLASAKLSPMFREMAIISQQEMKLAQGIA